MTQSTDSSYYARKRQGKGRLRFKAVENDFHLLRKVGFYRWMSSLDGLLRSVAIAIIGHYQRYLSPRKGYSCAHRITYGGDSCSQYVKKTLADKSLFEATLLARQRFKACSTAYVSSRNQVIRSRVPLIGPSGCSDPEMIGTCCAIFSIFQICGDNQKKR
jgi:putative component of membrane protein insertase Oxa1/YidC/SpoIIIJ protein YidD